ncbi:MAG TPA: hypothetical protein VKV26_07030 [Dehalococcoidia bacterium]|nr:hypothetical protein [Dehalococcoidia bacterium]
MPFIEREATPIRCDACQGRGICTRCAGLGAAVDCLACLRSGRCDRCAGTGTIVIRRRF